MKPAVTITIEQVAPKQRRVHEVIDHDIVCELPPGAHDLYTLESANEQLIKKLLMLPAGFYGDKWISEDEFAAIVEALK